MKTSLEEACSFDEEDIVKDSGFLAHIGGDELQNLLRVELTRTSYEWQREHVVPHFYKSRWQ